MTFKHTIVTYAQKGAAPTAFAAPSTVAGSDTPVAGAADEKYGVAAAAVQPPVERDAAPVGYRTKKPIEHSLLYKSYMQYGEGVSILGTAKDSADAKAGNAKPQIVKKLDFTKIAEELAYTVNGNTNTALGYRGLMDLLHENTDAQLGILSVVDRDAQANGQTQFRTGVCFRRNAEDVPHLKDQIKPTELALKRNALLMRSLSVVRAIDFVLHAERMPYRNQLYLLFKKYLQDVAQAEKGSKLDNLEIEFNCKLLAFLNKNGLANGITNEADLAELLDRYRNFASLIDPAMAMETFTKGTIKLQDGDTTKERQISRIQTNFPITEKTAAQKAVISKMHAPAIPATALTSVDKNFHNAQPEPFRKINRAFADLAANDLRRTGAQTRHYLPIGIKNGQVVQEAAIFEAQADGAAPASGNLAEYDQEGQPIPNAQKTQCQIEVHCTLRSGTPSYIGKGEDESKAKKNAKSGAPPSDSETDESDDEKEHGKSDANAVTVLPKKDKKLEHYAKLNLEQLDLALQRLIETDPALSFIKNLPVYDFCLTSKVPVLNLDKQGTMHDTAKVAVKERSHSNGGSGPSKAAAVAATAGAITNLSGGANRAQTPEAPKTVMYWVNAALNWYGRRKPINVNNTPHEGDDPNKPLAIMRGLDDDVVSKVRPWQSELRLENTCKLLENAESDPNLTPEQRKGMSTLAFHALIWINCASGQDRTTALLTIAILRRYSNMFIGAMGVQVYKDAVGAIPMTDAEKAKSERQQASMREQAEAFCFKGKHEWWATTLAVPGSPGAKLESQQGHTLSKASNQHIFDKLAGTNKRPPITRHSATGRNKTGWTALSVFLSLVGLALISTGFLAIIGVEVTLTALAVSAAGTGIMLAIASALGLQQANTKLSGWKGKVAMALAVIGILGGIAACVTGIGFPAGIAAIMTALSAFSTLSTVSMAVVGTLGIAGGFFGLFKVDQLFDRGKMGNTTHKALMVFLVVATLVVIGALASTGFGVPVAAVLFGTTYGTLVVPMLIALGIMGAAVKTAYDQNKKFNMDLEKGSLSFELIGVDKDPLNMLGSDAVVMKAELAAGGTGPLFGAAPTTTGSLSASTQSSDATPRSTVGSMSAVSPGDGLAKGAADGNIPPPPRPASGSLAPHRDTIDANPNALSTLPGPLSPLHDDGDGNNFASKAAHIGGPVHEHDPSHAAASATSAMMISQPGRASVSEPDADFTPASVAGDPSPLAQAGSRGGPGFSANPGADL